MLVDINLAFGKLLWFRFLLQKERNESMVLLKWNKIIFCTVLYGTGCVCVRTRKMLIQFSPLLYFDFGWFCFFDFDI